MVATMAEKPVPPKTLSEKNTKQEMLDAYRAVVRQLQDRRAAELNPEKRLQEKQAEEAVAVAAELAPDGVERSLGNLKADIGQSLAQIAERMASEVARFKAVQKAVESKERELQELYGIEKAAASLAALIEAQHQKRQDFEIELGRQKEELTREIESTRADWEKEKKSREAENREREALEKKNREREKEEFAYLFKREQQSVRDKLNDEKAALEKEILAKRESAAKELAEREKAVAVQEKELTDLRQRAAALPEGVGIGGGQGGQGGGRPTEAGGQEPRGTAAQGIRGRTQRLRGAHRRTGKDEQGSERPEREAVQAARGRVPKGPGDCREGD